jgi:hypothetical protein
MVAPSMDLPRAVSLLAGPPRAHMAMHGLRAKAGAPFLSFFLSFAVWLLLLQQVAASATADSSSSQVLLLTGGQHLSTVGGDAMSTRCQSDLV